MDEVLLRSRMNEVLSLVTSDVGTIRTGRATPALVEDIEITAYGGTQKLKVKEIGTISTPDSQTLLIEPWDKSIVGEVRQGILAANIGLNPSVDGVILRISLPPLTSEDREKYVKLLSTKLENGKVMIRQIRGDAMRDIKKSFEDKETSEDEKFNSEKHLQEITDEYISKIDQLGDRKKQELLQI